MGSFLGFNKMLWFLFQFHDSFTIFSPFQTLLDLGASPNYKDAQGLTPLYHCVCHSTNPHVAESLLHDHSLLGIQDEQGWAEVHQVRDAACRLKSVGALEMKFVALIPEQIATTTMHFLNVPGEAC